uniref:Uncharacterized protein n=1 Tax=virus sp. ctQSn51 TaxID=2828252 RepID=A0A8S5RBW7_9VIRU|nr:MAG TPA: hypothetical protein [virus sp. ctQSn51]
MEIVASCPHATQAMVNALLQTMKGYQYQAYEAGAANIDPAAELGDGVTVGGIYSPLSKISDDGRGYAGISSPGEAEMEDEYPSDGYITQEFNRKIAETRSTITKTSKEIMLKVEGLDGKYTEVKTTLDGLTVTDASGTTKINGSSIKTDNLYVAAANITGTLTANQIQTGSIRVGDLKDGSNYATKTYVDNNAGLSASEVDSAIETYIDETSITAEKLRGRTVELLASSNQSIGSIELAYTTTGYGIAINTTYGGIQLNSGGKIYLSAYDGAFITLSDVVSLGGGPLLIGSKVYGPSLPSNPQYGQLFFLKK